jgi:hypothetical protein
MARKAPPQKPPTISPERALRALTEQLEALQKLKGRRYDEADAKETEWMHLTENIIEAVFGEPSSSLDRFFAASHAGSHFTWGNEPIPRRRLEQNNFEARFTQFDALLKALVNTLRLQLPEEEIKGVYEPGEQYDFYHDLSSLIATATQDVLIVDAYLDRQFFDLYVAQVPGNVTVRILSGRIGTNVETVARMYVKNRPLELRSSADIHDRMLFIDQRGWTSGQSTKDAARNKPTCLIELSEPLLSAARDIYNRLWAAAPVVVQP